MAFGPFRGLPGVEAQSAMGHAHLVFFGSRRLLRPGTRTAHHSLALSVTLHYNVRVGGDLLRDPDLEGHSGGEPGGPNSFLRGFLRFDVRLWIGI